jgi:myo-inositol-1(or 4)-monophosphatase
MIDLAARQRAAELIAIEAGTFCKTLFLNRSELVIESKGAQDFVTRADRESEEIIRAGLAKAFPEDGFLGEESGAGESRSGGIWVVDPIDGTINFTHGVRYWCISIAYWQAGAVQIGVVYDPMADEMFSASKGAGATCNGQAMAVSQCQRIDMALLCHGYIPRHNQARNFALRKALFDAGAAIKDMGAGALMLAHVAAGRYDAYLEEQMHPWDAMAGYLLITEAGGRTNAYPRDPADILKGGTVLATTPAIYHALELIQNSH